MNAIVVVDKSWGIGRNNGLLFRIPSDLRYFKEKTLGKVVVMGGNTLRSLPGAKPLKDRVNIVLSRTEKRDGCIVVSSLDGLKQVLKGYKDGDIFIAGGAELYRNMLHYCDKAYVTKVDAYGGAEVFFENLDTSPDWVLEHAGGKQTDGGLELCFCTYKNLKVKRF